MKNKTVLQVLILVLFVIGIGTTLYKIKVLGFSFSPDKKERIWTVEAEITFEAEGGPVEVSLNSPDNTEAIVVTKMKAAAPGYEFSIKEVNGVRRGVWTASHAEGPQRIYLRTNVYRRDDLKRSRPADPPKPVEGKSLFTDAYQVAAGHLIQQAKEQGDSPKDFSLALLNLLNNPEKNNNAAILLDMPRESGGRISLARDILLEAKIPARVARGVYLSKKRTKKKKIQIFLEVYDGKEWLLIDPKEVSLKNTDDFLLWEKGKESLLEIEGGTGSKVRFSSVSTKILANQAAIDAGGNKQALLIDFSIYTLPIADQNTFKLLLLIPFGALVVVILRNLVGIKTSGTFMPILIALTFLQTSLFTGLLLFLVVVSVGLILRSYLSRLNLLLVPRISAVLVFVIVIYLAVSVVSYKMGSDFGLNVTFFPMIIISWTIERMSILWEEEGPHEVFIQGGGSLFTASLVYLLMMNRYIGHLTYSFPELLLVVLGIILMIGSYTGYRLSELRRFEPMAKE